jgi:hypothetical protein
MSMRNARWQKVTNEMVSKIKSLAKRKIRLGGKGRRAKRELWAYWDANEKCFFWDSGECAVYMDDPLQRPTHILVG